MKKFIPLVVLAALLMVSCEKDNETLYEDDSLNLEINVQSASDDVNSRTIQPMSELEKKMFWTGFVAVEAIMTNNDAKADFLAAFGSNTVIDVTDVLGGSVNSDFKDEFKAILLSYINSCINAENPSTNCPGAGTGNPPGPVQGGSLTNQAKVDLFMDFITSDHCLEFFLPKSLVLSPGYTITSTAHPLTISNSNEGYLRSLTPLPRTTDTYTQFVSSVNNNYASNNNVIVVRPERKSTPTNNCDYNQYSFIDFTLFLGSLL